jgi:hypothetical protein
MQTVQTAARHEIVVCITGESPDSRGTVVAHEASKEAVNKWTMRQSIVVDFDIMHCIGQATDIHIDDEQRKVFMQIRLTRRASDVWERIQEKNIIGAGIALGSPVIEQRDGLFIVMKYDLVHISLLNDPLCPDCVGITILR